MTPEAKMAFLEQVLAVHSDPRDAMAEGRPHRRAKGRALDELSLHFSSTGRSIYLADEMAVVYPGRESFQPDLLAVLDVEQPEEDERMAWVVADEGRGLDLVLEVLHHGNRDKDLRRNVALYAELGIREYFVYDRLNFCIHGFRLPGPAAVEYRALRPRLGRYTSQVLGLDLAIVERRLRFFAGHAELIGSDELIGRLSKMMDGVEGRAKELEKQVEAAEARARAAEARVRAEAERAQAEAERAQAEAERAQAEAERAQGLLRTVREGILLVLSSRQIAIPEAVQDAIQACQDDETLRLWLRRAATVTDALLLVRP
jgi:Uma2 family endonuclease